MAASYASQKLNATSNALKAGQQPQSIQGMINSYPQTAPNGSYYGPKGAGALNTNARYAAARSVGFNPDPVQRTPGDAEAMGRMMMAESATIKNQYGNPSVPGLMGVGEVMRNRMLSERFPDTVQGVMTQRKQFSPWGDGSYARTPANPMATSIAESILSGESPPTVGTSLNYGNIDTINNKPNYSSAASKAAFNSMPVEARIADARNPNTFSHSFGTIGPASDVAFNGTGAPAPSVVAASTGSRPEAIPAPSSVGMLGTYNQPQVASAAPALPGLAPNFRGTAGVASTGVVPGWGYSPLADGRSSSPPPAPTQVASADETAPVYSDNPVQGSQNPMQDEGENPQVKSDRQKKYASRGATLGGIIAGPIGTIVGGTLGWQMGKTSPQQRRAIASNPQALQANVQSINDMVEQRGGKNNPNLKVTEVGLKDVLENPQKVTANPQSYTSLEQSLAALSQGIDPETGRVI
jgi:spore germination cell wall hydrolase CwlJ-like protein